MEGKKANSFDWPLGVTVYECLVNFLWSTSLRLFKFVSCLLFSCRWLA